jgi:cytochrome c oxidase cbb3-type subunit 3
VGRDRGIEYAIAALVAMDVLRHHRLGLRLLDRLPGLADDQRLYRRRSGLLHPRSGRCRSRRPADDAGGARRAALLQVPLADIEKDPALLAFAQAQGKAAFGNDCAPCHGVGATGAKGYPNLNDDDWLWGGTLEEIVESITYGIRSGNSKAHESAMPAFGKDGLLKSNEIVAVANYVRSLSGLSVRPGVDLAAGKRIFADNCAFCHGADGTGNPELGAPNLTDRIWLYGSDEPIIIETISNSRVGVMPAWAGRLDPATINALAVYVHTLGGGK